VEVDNYGKTWRIKESINEGPGDWLKKGLAGAALAGGLATATPFTQGSQDKTQSSLLQKFQKPQFKANVGSDRKHVLAAIREIETSGGKNLNHQWIKSRSKCWRKSYRPIRFHAKHNERTNQQRLYLKV
jgi:hypothetical protein